MVGMKEVGGGLDTATTITPFPIAKRGVDRRRARTSTQEAVRQVVIDKWLDFGHRSKKTERDG
ncbi:hypothetical protein WDV06_05330 [Streptomyces racemochromogenes]|uniref:Transposase n=1 Tax=Streptomyces racemochromogenes TaxID=67353 RepID=A0ABW7P849_9ACTN